MQTNICDIQFVNCKTNPPELFCTISFVPSIIIMKQYLKRNFYISTILAFNITQISTKKNQIIAKQYKNWRKIVL